MTYKALGRYIAKYAASVWSTHASESNIGKIQLLLFAMIRSVVKSFKVPDVEVVAARMSNELALIRMTDLISKTLVRLDAVPGWMTPIFQMKDLLLGGSTTCRRESLELQDTA